MEIKWTDRHYHVQGTADVAQQYVRMYCNKNKFSVLTFFGPDSKPHGARGLSKYYFLRFDTKLGNGVSATRNITCACVACTEILDKHGYLVYHQMKRAI